MKLNKVEFDQKDLEKYGEARVSVYTNLWDESNSFDGIVEKMAGVLTISSKDSDGNTVSVYYHDMDELIDDLETMDLN